MHAGGKGVRREKPHMRACGGGGGAAHAFWHAGSRRGSHACGAGVDAAGKSMHAGVGAAAGWAMHVGVGGRPACMGFSPSTPPACMAFPTAFSRARVHGLTSRFASRARMHGLPRHARPSSRLYVAAATEGHNQQCMDIGPPHGRRRHTCYARRGAPTVTAHDDLSAHHQTHTTCASLYPARHYAKAARHTAAHSSALPPYAIAAGHTGRLGRLRNARRGHHAPRCMV